MNIKLKHLFALSIAGSLFLTACGNDNSTATAGTTTTESKTEAPQVAIPNFNAEQAYQNIATQVAFGPRVPNTEGQKLCADWLYAQLKASCDTVYMQETSLMAGDKKTSLKCYNIIGSINPQAKRRILLLAHWDTRPWADRDHKNADQPILGADDGGSGVGVILELARIIKENPLPNKDLGIDILFADVEDYGRSEWGSESYALGTQYWARNPHIPGYKAEAGILLDMVGGKNASFQMEGYSKQYAYAVLKNVWNAAAKAGYGSYFVNTNGGFIEDDHVPVNKITKIPTIDIINLPQGSNTGFVNHWHTHNDNMDAIDKNTLKAVGQTLLQYLYTL